MLHEKSSFDKIEEYKSLSDLNLLGLSSATGHEWTSMIRKESLGITNQSVQEGQPKSSRNIVSLGVVAFLLLLGAATLSQPSVVPQISQQNVNLISGK